MATGGLSIERVRVGDLPELVRSVESQPDRYRIVPITPHRAEAHARNPASDPDQTGLLVAYLDGRCVGYLGLLPVLLENHGRRVKVDCLSALYVAPEQRHTGAGSLLVLRAMSLGKDLITVGTSEAATRLYLAHGFTRAGPLRCLRIRIEALLGLSYTLGALGRRMEDTGPRRLRVVLDASRRLVQGTLDVGLRRLLVRLPRRLLRTSCHDVMARPTSRVERPSERESELASQRMLRFVRDEDTVNWMIAYPWITEDGGRQSNYTFSHHRDLFRFLPYELRRRTPDENLGYIVLSVSSQSGRTTLKILDHVLRDESLRACAFSHALQEARRWSADTLEASVEWWSLVAASPVLRSVAALTDRVYLVYTQNAAGPLGAQLGELAVGYCDGEAPFT